MRQFLTNFTYVLKKVSSTVSFNDETCLNEFNYNYRTYKPFIQAPSSKINKTKLNPRRLYLI